MQKPENSQKVINVDKKQPSRSKQQSLLDAQILTKNEVQLYKNILFIWFKILGSSSKSHPLQRSNITVSDQH